MTRRRQWIEAIVVAGVVGMTGCGVAEEGLVPPAPAMLPRLQVNDIEGAPASIDAFRGRVVVLNVWATWCGPCRRELPSLDRLSLHLDAARFVVAGVAVDGDPIAVREYLLQNAVSFPNFVAAERRAVENALATHALPQTLIIAADGSLVERIDGARRWDTPAQIARIEAVWHRNGAKAPPPRAPADGPPPRGRFVAG